MPFHLPPLTRRRFLQGAVAGAGLLSVRAWGEETPQVDPNRWALLSDTHIAADPKTVRSDVVMADNLRRVVEEVTAAGIRPAGVLLDGDCAFLKGEPGDYATLGPLLKPLSAAGIPVHMTLGNHDDRANFRTGFAEQLPRQKLLEAKHVSIVESPRVNWFLLDSLDKVNQTPGSLGEEQLAWLARELDTRSEKPAVVLAHHTPELVAPPKPFGIQDTEALLKLLASRKQVKAFIYGHSHNWATASRDGLHLINLPPVAYVFQKGKPNGWVDARLNEAGMSLTLNCLDKQHASHGQRVDLAWR